MENEPKAKLNWWVDLVLFLVAPVLTLLAAMLGTSEDVVAFFVMAVPIPLAMALAVRTARRTGFPLAALLFACVFYGILVFLCMFGCTFGGGKFNLH